MNPNNNWHVQFQHGGTQYGAAGSASYTPAQGAYNYGAPQRAPAYDQSAGYAAASQSYPAAPQPTYDYGYGRPAQTYDTSKTYYQQAGASYVAAPSYVDNGAAKATYAQPPTRAPIQQQQKVTQYQATYANPATTAATNKPQPTNTSSAAYSNYDNALYSATVYMAQQTNKTPGNPNQQPQGQPGWQQKKGNTFKQRTKPPNANKVQQVHYCDVCRISCAGPQTYREHLEGQKHKKREALQKASTDPQTPVQGTVRGSNLRCELCDVTCTGNDAYAAHVRGSKHQKVVKLHTKLGKPIPSAEPQPIGIVKEKEGELDDVPAGEDIKPVGEEYIEEMKDADGKIVTFNCKLCDCKFNDPNAKEMHTKGRRHRLQYKKKVQPDLVVDVKPTLRQRKMAEREKQRQQMQEEFWNRRRESEMDDEERIYWEERRRFEEESGDVGQPWMPRNFRGIPGRAPLIGFPMFNNGRRIESLDDRHVVARHAEIYPKEEELQAIQRIVSHTERALKLVSDAMTEVKPLPVDVTEAKAEVTTMETQPAVEVENKEAVVENKNGESKENGNQNQMISFQKETEGTIRLLKGVMRVGLLAKGLLLQGDNVVQLVVLCAEKPTSSVLKRVVNELPLQLKKISEDHKYTVTMAPVEGAVLVSDGSITVKVSLTSPLLREPADTNTSTETVSNVEDLLPKEPCLQALAALRHSKWFQARATGLQSCVMIMRIMRDMCQRIPTFTPLSQWVRAANLLSSFEHFNLDKNNTLQAMELLTEKIISSAGMPLSPGDCLRRVMEALSSGILVQGPGLMDPCEKEPVDALNGLTKQQREDITVTAQQFLRYIAFRQIHKVLGMDPLPVQKYQGNRPWKFNAASRKRRRSGTETSEGDGQKMVKKEGESNVAEAGEKMETEAK